MTTSTVTPGPWSVKYNEQDEFKAYEVVGPGKNEWVCECGYGGNAEACANFIAASPDLYNALKAIVGRGCPIVTHHRADCEFCAGLKALAKADGRTL